MKKFVCLVCGYVHTGDEPPASCPICGAGADQFKEMPAEAPAAAPSAPAAAPAGERVWADEHRVGIAKGVDPEVVEMLRANFTGECSEVGMYLAMARVAHREGYPEIGLYWEKAAYEEAEHAAKFAEMLGSDLEPNMKASTKDNLKWRVDCEFGATAGKFDLALCAKKNGLDAIHDTVHEMARDEARHGRALKGLLERYFK